MPKACEGGFRHMLKTAKRSASSAHFASLARFATSAHFASLARFATLAYFVSSAYFAVAFREGNCPRNANIRRTKILPRRAEVTFRPAAAAFSPPKAFGGCFTLIPPRFRGKISVKRAADNAAI